jgi:hypothetical protein
MWKHGSYDGWHSSAGSVGEGRAAGGSGGGGGCGTGGSSSSRGGLGAGGGGDWNSVVVVVAAGSTDVVGDTLDVAVWVSGLGVGTEGRRCCLLGVSIPAGVAAVVAVSFGPLNAIPQEARGQRLS